MFKGPTYRSTVAWVIKFPTHKLRWGGGAHSKHTKALLWIRPKPGSVVIVSAPLSIQLIVLKPLLVLPNCTPYICSFMMPCLLPDLSTLHLSAWLFITYVFNLAHASVLWPSRQNSLFLLFTSSWLYEGSIAGISQALSDLHTSLPRAFGLAATSAWITFLLDICMAFFSPWAFFSNHLLSDHLSVII